MPQAIDLSLASPMMRPRLPAISPVDIPGPSPTLAACWRTGVGGKAGCRKGRRPRFGQEGRHGQVGNLSRARTRSPSPGAWLAEAEATEPNDPNAIALATVDPDGLPNVRMVLLKDIEADAFVFYTNYGSAKGQEIEAAGKAAFVMHWKSLRRQIRVRGTVTREEGPQADAYFHSRSLKSRLGAWASQQSQPLSSREALMAEVAKVTLRHGAAPAAPAVLGRLPHPPGRDRILGRWRLPPA
jgi:pyridoxamine 5'-phosphate oxidase